MQVVILCGGLGTRLREETEFRPKPMLEIGGRPILWHIMKTYSHYGFRDFVLCLGYRGQMIKEYFLNYEAMTNDFTICLGRQQRLTFHNAHDEQHFHVTLADTGQDAMTGARLRKASRYLNGDTFLLTYGDGVSDVNVAELIEFHQSHGRLATVTSVAPVSRFGILDLSGEGSVERFVEKPGTGTWANAGYFVFDRRVLQYLDPGDDCVLERGPLERLASDGQLMAYKHRGFFYPMDTYREYQHLNELWDAGAAPWKVW
ncbi:MAG: glucose-1-phosphate cytidylyltransferase [Bryobacteraceae bacterium]